MSQITNDQLVLIKNYVSCTMNNSYYIQWWVTMKIQLSKICNLFHYWFVQNLKDLL